MDKNIEDFKDIKDTVEEKVNNDIVINQNKIADNIIKTQKLSSKKWGLIEKPLSESDKQRNKIICDLGEKNASTYKHVSNLITIGEYNYLKIREELTKYIILPPLTKIEEKKQKINKKTQIILNNCQNTLKNKIDILINILKNNPQEQNYEDLLSNFNYVEMRLLILMKIIENYTDIKSVSSIRNKIPLKFQNQNETQNKITPEKEEILLASKKIIHLLKKIKSNDNNFDDYFNKIFSIEGIKIELCDQLIKDLDYKITCLSNECKTKLFEIANRRPKLIFDTKYDITIPQLSLKPYDSQIELMNNIKNNIDNGVMILYKTLPGLGKTSMILGICKYIKKSNLNIKIIFCCSDILESVRVQVLRTMYNFGVKFGIANSVSINSETKYKITNSWNCSKDEDRELIVSDYISTYLILKEKKHDYLLFFDEPTVHTDNDKNNSTLEYLSKILYYMPKYTILSSATLPLISEMKNIITNYKTNYPESNICEIVSNKTLTGCIIKDFNNKVIIPHSICNNINELSELINKIKHFPLLGKFYTLPFLMNLNEFMKQYNKNIDLETIETFDQANILENILLLLERVCSLSDTQFAEFKKIEIFDINEEQFDKSKLDIKYDFVIPEKLLTTHAYKYIGCCLIAVDNPLQYTKDNLYSIVNKLKEKVNIININSDYEKYKRDLKKFEEQIDIINEKFNQDDKIDEEIEKIMHKKPEFKFPPMLEINTTAHIETFARYVKNYDNSLLKLHMTHENIDITDFDIDEELKFLLFMGVGLYCKNLDSDYCNLVLELLSDRQLAYVIADESFCYGANYQISNVIINDCIGNSHSINTILQLIGRTSRVGKSWSGKVYLDTNSCKRIIDFFGEPSNNSNEGKNISNSFNNVIHLINKEKDLEKQKEDEEKQKLEKQQQLLLLEKEKEKQAKLFLIQQKNESINKEKLEWKLLRQNKKDITQTQTQTQTQTSENSDSNVKIFKIPKLSSSNDDWSDIRSKRVPINPDKSSKPFTFSNINNIKEKVDKQNNKVIEPIKIDTDTNKNMNFRQKREDEIFNLLYKKNNKNQ
jgi:hypothetical protein